MYKITMRMKGKFKNNFPHKTPHKGFMLIVSEGNKLEMFRTISDKLFFLNITQSITRITSDCQLIIRIMFNCPHVFF